MSLSEKFNGGPTFDIRKSKAGKISESIKTLNEILDTIPKNLEGNFIPYSKLGLELFERLHEISLKLNVLEQRNEELDKTLNLLAGKHFEWLERFLIRFPIIFLTEDYDPEQVKILRSGIDFMMRLINKEANAKLMDKVKIIDNYLSKLESVDKFQSKQSDPWNYEGLLPALD
jgi:hypothetical protein